MQHGWNRLHRTRVVGRYHEGEAKSSTERVPAATDEF